MKKLWLFNPENDIALAHGSANFTPPTAAVRLRNAGEILPLWIADDGDAVMCSGINNRWLEDIQAKFGINVEPWNHSTEFSPSPWGWSAATRKHFELNGFPCEHLPDDTQLEQIRNLSHRRTSIKLADNLSAVLPFKIWQSATEITNIDHLKSIFESAERSVIKSPWSSSGRGIIFVDQSNRSSALRQAEGIIRKQGSVMLELAAERIIDFAMLFDYSPEKCNFNGYSLFSTDNRGGYCGNVIASQDVIFKEISCYIPPEQLIYLSEILPNTLHQVFGNDYSGPVGIDMLVAKTDNGNVLNAVVEINLRQTMGFVALRLARLIKGRGEYLILPGDHTSVCHATIENQKLINGAIALNPPGCDFTFILRSKH